jgi:hypothetical protein
MACAVCEGRADRQPGVGDFARYDCDRCGTFVLTGSGEAVLPGQLAVAPIRRSLMSHALRRIHNSRPERPPRISGEDASSYWSIGRLPSPNQLADNLILWIGTAQETPLVRAATTIPALAATIGLPVVAGGDKPSLEWLDAELQPANLYRNYDMPNGQIRRQLTLNGWSRFEELRRKAIDSRTAFKAMQFGDQNLNSAVEECFRPAVARTGFTLRVLTDQQPAGLIDDQLRAALLGSRFVIADLSHSNRGAYWEAGFGEGLGLPVIYTCEQSAWEQNRTHFDTNHMLTIKWEVENLQDAQNRLVATIRATLRSEAKQTD